MSTFKVNYARGNYHPDDRVNAIIQRGKNCSLGIYEMVDNLELLLGCKGAWKTQEIASQYQRRSITFDQFIAQYLDLPKKIHTDDEKQQEISELQSNLWSQQAIAYEDNERAEYCGDTVKVVKRLLQKYIFRNCVFPTEERESFKHPNFVILDDKDREDALQSSIIGDILFTHLKKSEDSITEKVYWWKTFNSEIYSHFSTLHSQVVRIQFTNFIQFYEKERKHITPSDITEGDMSSICKPSHETYIETPFNLLLQVCEQNSALLADEILDANIEKDAYSAFLDVCASAFFPKDKFKAHMRTNALSKVLTETEEAFALLCLENNFERWMWCAEMGKRPENLTCIDGLPNLCYQDNPTQRKDKKINGGKWTPAGKKRMNDLLQKVAASRIDHKDFEKDLKNMYIMGCSADELESGWIRTNNSLKKRRREYVPVKNCLSISKRAAV